MLIGVIFALKSTARRELVMQGNGASPRCWVPARVPATLGNRAQRAQLSRAQRLTLVQELSKVRAHQEWVLSRSGGICCRQRLRSTRPSEAALLTPTSDDAGRASLQACLGPMMSRRADFSIMLEIPRAEARRDAPNLPATVVPHTHWWL